MKIFIPVALAFTLMSGIVQAQYGGIYNPYPEERQAAEERKLRMQLMEEQRQALQDQKRMMESQQIRNELQTLEMLGPQQGRGLNYRGY